MRWSPHWEKERLEEWWSASTETSKGEELRAKFVPIQEKWHRASFLCLFRDERVAVKIVRNFESFCEVARSEIVVLEEIKNLDDDNKL